MSERDDPETEALHVLRKILEEATDMGADAVELELEEKGLEVCYMFGHTGVGNILLDHKQGQYIIEFIIEKAKIDKNSCGKMHMDFHKGQHTIVVEEYENFGESAFRLILDKPERQRVYH